MEAHLVQLNTYLIAWTADDVSGASTLLRSERPHDGFEPVADVTGLLQYQDVPSDEEGVPHRPRRGRQWYWKVESESGSTRSVTTEGPVDAYALEAARLAYRNVQRDIGGDALIVAPATLGERCPDCYDATRRARVRSSCATCSSSGFLGGWPAPIAARVCFGQQVVHPQQFSTMKFEAGQFQLWMPNRPLLRENDLIIRRRDLEVFEVVQWQPTQRNGLIIRQNLACRIVERSKANKDLIDHALNTDPIELEHMHPAQASAA